MKEIYRNENVTIYQRENGRIVVYTLGVYYYQTTYDKTITQMESHNFIKFSLTDTEKEFINYLMCKINRNDFIEELDNFYNWDNQKQFTVKKDEFHDYELEVLLENDFDNYYCYSDESNYNYLIIEKKVGDKNDI